MGLGSGASKRCLELVKSANRLAHCRSIEWPCIWLGPKEGEGCGGPKILPVSKPRTRTPCGVVELMLVNQVIPGNQGWMTLSLRVSAESRRFG